MKVGNLVKWGDTTYCIVLKVPENNDGYILIATFYGDVCWITESWLEVIA
tara:strand:+ start:145 stop:294 length:150 start_codon:yes stop_codon:yes gene_type:complete